MRSEQLAGVLTEPPPAPVCLLVTSPEELRTCRRIRHLVFVEEQGIFSGSDRDDHDLEPGTLQILGSCQGVAGGTVRLYPTDPSGAEWQGDRLAVLPEFRARGLGQPLVRLAVRIAAERGGRVMRAHIQLANVRFFQRLGWRTAGDPEDYCGRPHQGMVIDLQAPSES